MLDQDDVQVTAAVRLGVQHGAVGHAVDRSTHRGGTDASDEKRPAPGDDRLDPPSSAPSPATRSSPQQDSCSCHRPGSRTPTRSPRSKSRSPMSAPPAHRTRRCLRIRTWHRPTPDRPPAHRTKDRRAAPLPRSCRPRPHRSCPPAPAAPLVPTSPGRAAGARPAAEASSVAAPVLLAHLRPLAGRRGSRTSPERRAHTSERRRPCPPLPVAPAAPPPPSPAVPAV